jgi:hypothetical protein
VVESGTGFFMVPFSSLRSSLWRETAAILGGRAQIEDMGPEQREAQSQVSSLLSQCLVDRDGVFPAVTEVLYPIQPLPGFGAFVLCRKS